MLLEPLVESFTETIKEQVSEISSDIWDENKTFLTQMAKDIGEFTWEAFKAQTDEEKEMWRGGIEDTHALITGRIHSESIRIKVEHRDAFVTVLMTVAKMAMKFALKFLIPIPLPN